MNQFARFYFKPAEGEQVETEVHIKEDKRSAISGTIKDSNDQPVDGAVLTLFEAGQKGENIRFISRIISDSDGYFMFGPLQGGKLYMIKVFKNNINVRELEIKI